MSSLTPTIVSPASGISGLPSGTKEAGKRSDFRTKDFDLQIEGHGYRLAWSRAAQCPCTPDSDQTEQPSINCSVCEGSGWFYFAPSEPKSDTFGALNEVQEAIIAQNSAGYIRGIMTSGMRADEPYREISRWTSGEMLLTVRAENRLGYYDKIVNLDDELVYQQKVEATGTDSLELRYLANGINLIRTIDTVYVPEIDYTLEVGVVKWLISPVPAQGVELLVHYLMHPTWLVTSYPHAVRLTSVKAKQPTDGPFPLGVPTPLPIQAKVELDFLRKRGTG